jgi:hypothetical protein
LPGGFSSIRLRVSTQTLSKRFAAISPKLPASQTHREHKHRRSAREL